MCEEEGFYIDGSDMIVSVCSYEEVVSEFFASLKYHIKIERVVVAAKN